jgi:hypothetical protein
MERMRIPAPARWIGLALLGMLIAAAISIAASRVASQQIGLASEPITAGDALAPKAQKQEAPTRPRPRHRVLPKHPNQPLEKTQPSEPTPPVVPPATEPAPSPHGDDSGGATEADGEHGGGGADD